MIPLAVALTGGAMLGTAWVGYRWRWDLCIPRRAVYEINLYWLAAAASWMAVIIWSH